MKINKKILDEIEKIAKGYFENAAGCHDWSHVQRVYALSMRIGKEENADLNVLKVAALLHDIAREEESRSKGKICHAIRGGEMAKEILKKFDLDEKFIENVVGCVKTHRFRNNLKPETIEAKVLFDADKLDAIGAVGIGRAFMFAGEMGNKFYVKIDDLSKTKEYTKEDTAYREYLVKLKHVKNKLFTKTGKKIARERDEFMKEFFKRFLLETRGKL